MCVFLALEDVFKQRPVDWREIFVKQSVGKCKQITSRIFVFSKQIVLSKVASQTKHPLICIYTSLKKCLSSPAEL